MTIYKSFIRPHLDYGDIIYDQPDNENFCQKLESFQYNAALAITGAIKGTSQDKLYKELGLETLRFRRKFRRLCTLFRIMSSGLPKYLFNLIPSDTHLYNTRGFNKIGTYYCRTEAFKKSFFPHTIIDWNNLPIKLRTSKSLLSFRRNLLNSDEGRPPPKPIYNIHNPAGIKFLTRLRLGLSHLREHKFNHNFEDCINPLCSCSLETESIAHYFLHCHHFSEFRTTLFDDLRQIDLSIFNLPDDEKVQLLLYGSDKYNSNQNRLIINASIKFILSSERFKGPII